MLYQRVSKLFAALALARGDGRYARILRDLAGVQLLILDDWGLEPLDAGARHDLYEIREDRYGRRSHPHQPDPGRQMARRDRRPDLCRRHPRPSRPQRLPHRSDRRQPASKTLDRDRPCSQLRAPGNLLYSVT